MTTYEELGLTLIGVDRAVDSDETYVCVWTKDEAHGPYVALVLTWEEAIELRNYINGAEGDRSSLTPKEG